MNHYIDPTTKQIYAYEADGSQGEFIKPGLLLISDTELKALLAPTPDHLKAVLSGAVQDHLDRQARALGYDDIKTAVTYADEPAVPEFQMQGRALRAWRSNVWQECINQLAAINAGAATLPTSEQLIGCLPAFVAP